MPKKYKHEINNLTVELALEGVDICIENTHSFLAEAKLLAENKYYARAYTLSHLAFEETAKAAELISIAINLQQNVGVDYTDINEFFSKHPPKIKVTLLNLIYTFGKAKDKAGIDLTEAIKYLIKTYDDPDFLNDLKNYSLYVSYRDGMFISPSITINEKQFADMNFLATIALQAQKNFLRALKTDFEGNCKTLLELSKNTDEDAIKKRLEEDFNRWVL